MRYFCILFMSFEDANKLLLLLLLILLLLLSYLLKILTVDPCASKPCQNEGVCVVNRQTYMCQCPSGFSGQNCETGRVYQTSNKFSDISFFFAFMHMGYVKMSMSDINNVRVLTPVATYIDCAIFKSR